MELRKTQRPRKFILHDRDVQVVKMLSNGYRAIDVGAAGNVSGRTVEAIVSALCKQYKCNNTAHLVATFIRKKIIK